VHLGDVIEKADGTVYGGGVNIAADTKTHAPIGRHAGGERLEPPLHVERGADCTGRGIEHRKHRVARDVDDAAAVRFDLFAEDFASLVERGQRARIVSGHQSRITSSG
jgi:hypothetical protein